MSDQPRPEQQRLNAAILYAVQCGCFFPVPPPEPSASVEALVQWGALRHLHDAIRAFDRVHGFEASR
jgi:hypothetical protein